MSVHDGLEKLGETTSTSPWRLLVGIFTLALVVVILLAAGIRANQINCYRTRDTRATSLHLWPIVHPGRPVPHALRAEQISCSGLFPEDR